MQAIVERSIVSEMCAARDAERAELAAYFDGLEALTGCLERAKQWRAIGCQGNSIPMPVDSIRGRDAYKLARSEIAKLDTLIEPPDLSVYREVAFRAVDARFWWAVGRRFPDGCPSPRRVARAVRLSADASRL